MAHYDPIEFGIGRLFHITSEAIVVADLASEQIVLWNGAAQRIFGYSVEDAVGMRLDTLVPDDMREQHLAGIRRYRETRKPVLVGQGAVELPAVTKSGDPLFVALSLTDVTPEGSDRPYVAAVLRDVTAQRRAEHGLAQTNKAMRDFVATASHDLRSPLAVIEGFASMLLERGEDFDDEQRAEALTSVLSSAKQASRLVGDLLALSQIQAGVLPTRPATVNVGDAAGKAIESSGVAAQNNVQSGVMVTVDPDHLQRILVNYLSNAARYGKAPVAINASVAHGWVDLSVCDAGDGPPADFQERLFTSFARADASSRDGVGLGLSIVRGLAETNGGTAYFRHVGSCCFGVTLPAAP